MIQPTYLKTPINSGTTTEATVKLGDKVCIKDYSYSLLLKKIGLDYGTVGNDAYNKVYTVVSINCVLPASYDNIDHRISSKRNYATCNTILVDADGNYMFIHSDFLKIS